MRQINLFVFIYLYIIIYFYIKQLQNNNCCLFLRKYQLQHPLRVKFTDGFCSRSAKSNFQVQFLLNSNNTNSLLLRSYLPLIFNLFIANQITDIPLYFITQQYLLIVYYFKFLYLLNNILFFFFYLTNKFYFN